jgi:hypothetical protein
MQKVEVLVTLAIFCFAGIAHALTEENVRLFKADKTGTLHLVGAPSDTGKLDASIIVGDKALCGSLQKNTGKKQIAADQGCRSGYSGTYKFNQKHLVSDRELPLLLGFDSCLVKPLSPSQPSKETIERFKKDRGLSGYVSERAKQFTDSRGAEYLMFIGMKAKTKPGRNSEISPLDVVGAAKRDFLLVDVARKKSVLDLREQTCCDPKTANLVCEYLSQSESACFEPSIVDEKIVSFEGLLEDDGKLYSYAVGYGVEGAHGFVWEIANNAQKEVFHRPIYALGGCKQ